MFELNPKKTINRNLFIDLLKGYGIVLVILAHSGFWGNNIINLYHMALFFVISGFCYKNEHSDTLSSCKVYSCNKIKSLYLYYILYMGVFVIFHNLFCRINIYTNNFRFLEGQSGNSYGLIQRYTMNDFLIQFVKTLFFSSSEQLGGASWFVIVLFITSIVYNVIEYVIKKHTKKSIHVQTYISAVFLLIGYYLSIHNIVLKVGISIVFSIYFLFHFGVILRNLQLSKLNRVKDVPGYMCMCIICLSLLAILSRIGKIAVASNQYVNPVFFLVCSLVGLLFSYYLCRLIERVKEVRNILVAIGKNTIHILFLHFLAFKLVTAIYIAINHLEWYQLASFPVYDFYGSWIFYTIAGIFIPMLIIRIIRKGTSAN